MNDELWRVWASGGFNLLLAKMQSVTNIDLRARLLDGRDHLSWLRVELAASGSLAFAVSSSVLGLLWDEVQTSAYYAPELREQAVPIVTGATVTGGDTLEADPAPEGYETLVYSFNNGLTFAEIGLLSEHSTPGTGNYVLASVEFTAGVDEAPDVYGAVSLPSLFLTTTS